MVLEARSNFRVLTATDAVFGYPIAKAEQPDLIILDVIMPFEDGFAAAKKFKSERELADIPIILLTSFSNRVGETSVSIADGMDFVADDYVEKPVSPDELLRIIGKFLK